MASLTSIPSVGILVSASDLKAIRSSPFNSAARMHLLAAQKVGIQAFYFSLKNVAKGARLITGVSMLPDRRLVENLFHFPRVIYEQSGSPKKRREKLVLDRLLQSAVQINSVPALSKWFTHHALTTIPAMLPYLPRMQRVRGSKTVLEMLQRHPGVYLKSDMGSGGTGVFHIRRFRNGRYSWRSSMAQVDKMDIFSRQQLAKEVARVTSNRQFVAQAEIPLFKTKTGRRMDARVLMQKNGQGNWEIECIGLRIGPQGAIVTNTHLGGEWVYIEHSEHKIGWTASTRNRLKARLSHAAMVTVKHLEQAVGRMGEVGLDLAFDLNNQIWLIEANARPDKTYVRPTGQLETRFMRVMEYAKYLNRNQ